MSGPNGRRKRAIENLAAALMIRTQCGGEASQRLPIDG